MSGFPEELLELTAEAAWGADLTADPTTWTFTPFGNDTVLGVPRLMATPITHQHGTAVGASSSQTMSATIQALNNDGYLTPELATSAWWPYVDAGTPIRLRMRTRTSTYLTDLFGRTVSNNWGTTTTGGYLWTPGTASQYNVDGSQATITFTAKSNSSKAIKMAAPLRDVDFTFDVAINAVQTGVASVIGPSLREISAVDYVWPHFEFGLAGIVDCHVREARGGVLTSLVQVTQPGLTYTAGTVIRCRSQLVGRRLRMRAWLAAGTEPDAWTIDTEINVVATGDQTGIRSCVFTGNTNTLPVIFTVDNIIVSQAPYDRVEGYIADVKPTFNPQSGGTTWSTVQIDIGGIGTRLEKNESPAYSPLRRSVQLSDPPPVAYWPCEDDEGATFAASAFPGYAPLTVTGPAVFAFAATVPDTDFLSRYGSKPLVSLAAGARLAGPIPLSGVQTEWAMSCTAQFAVAQIPLTEMRILQWDTPGGVINRWAIVGTNVGYLVRAYNDGAATSTDVAVYSSGTFGASQINLTTEAQQNGANIDVRFYINDALLASGSIAGTTLTEPGGGRVMANPDRTNTTASVSPYGIRFLIGHIRVVSDVSLHDLPYYYDPDTSGLIQSGSAWYQESAHRRLERLCAEERVPYDFIGGTLTGSERTVLNAQRDGGFTDLVTQAAESESGGLLYEARFGYEYLPRSQRYNQAAALTIDMAVYKRSEGTDPGDVLAPQLDTRAANYWTIKRANGSTGSDAAPLAYRLRRGTIAEERTVDVLYDTDLDQHASWRVHTGVDGMGANYPSVLVDLAANPELIDEFLTVGIGSRVLRTNQPTVAGLGTIDQVVVGMSETISPTSWEATLTATPGSVWDVAVYDDPGSRYDSATTVIAGTAPTTTATAWTVSSTTLADTWSTTAEPYDWLVAGEQVTVTVMNAATGTGPYLQTCTVTRSVNGVVKAHALGEPVSLADPVYYAL